MKDLNLGLPQFEAFLDALGVPDTCLLNKPLYKKMFQEHAAMDARDKKALKDDVEKVRWLYTLKPSTINIAPYLDELRDYGELAILHIELSTTKQAERIGHFINRAIPYPLVIFFTHSIGKEGSGNNDELALCLADKRINMADKEKWVIEDLQLSPWIPLQHPLGDEPTVVNQNFLSSLNISALPTANFWQLYQALISRLIARQCAEVTGIYRLTNDADESQKNEYLCQYQQTELAIKKLRAQIQKAEFSQQVTLNTQIKQQEQKLKQLTELL